MAYGLAMTFAPYWQTFPALSGYPEFAHAFTLRHPEIDVKVDRDEAVRRLWAWHYEIASQLGFPASHLATAQQIHGAEVAVVDRPVKAGDPVPAVDGLISREPGLAIGIYVADCCAVYLLDPVSGAFGILHSGKKGSELGITSIAIRKMAENFGTKPENLIVQLSPCIRPPVYEVDFAAAIREQAASAGVPLAQIHDEGVCTSSDTEKFYSYRLEKGKTGRMFAILGRRATTV